jgi:trehalose 6-phosphate phosphatase
MELSPLARKRYDAVLAAAGSVVVGLDYDGTLAPIVADPSAAVIHPDAPEALVALAAQVRAVVVVTGRPAAQAVSLGGLCAVADRLPSEALLLVLGQYGNERWDSRSRTVSSPPPPAGLTALADELPALLSAHDAGSAFVEDKGLALAVHTRRLPDPEAAFARLRPSLAEAAQRHGLHLEPGRMVLEMRAPGMHKGEAVRSAAAELGAEALVFAGDDLGDVEAFRAVAELRDSGLPGLLVFSGSDESVVLPGADTGSDPPHSGQPGPDQLGSDRPRTLGDLADVVVDGPAGVVDFLSGLASDLTSPR